MKVLFSRRSALRVGGASLLGLSFPQLLAAAEKSKAPKATAKCVIFLHQWGGAGQHETFDMKPDAPENVRGWYKPMSSVVPGLPVCEKLPKIAKLMDRVSVVRCFTHEMKNHNSAGYYSLTGVSPATDDQRLRDSQDLFPAYGSIVSKLVKSDPGTAPFVAFPHVIADGSITPGQHASFLGKSHNPLFVADDPNKPDFRLPELSLPEGVHVGRLERRTEILKLTNVGSRYKCLASSTTEDQHTNCRITIGLLACFAQTIVHRPRDGIARLWSVKGDNCSRAVAFKEEF